MKLDLACGNTPMEGYIGVDLTSPHAHIQLDLMKLWPWEDNSVEAMHCSHFIEHIPTCWCRYDTRTTKDPFFWFFDEAYRVIEPGGLFRLQWPALRSVRAFQDPTHRRFIPLESMLYLNAKWRKQVNVSHYNVLCDWVIVQAGCTVGEEGASQDPRIWGSESDLWAVLEARKPAKL